MYDYPHIHCEFHGLVKWLSIKHETKEKDIYSWLILHLCFNAGRNKNFDFGWF